MPLRYQKWIERDDLLRHRDWVYVFGDNALRVGLGGQAKSMRGEPNAVGVATKRKPTMQETAFFSDDNPLDRVTLEGDLRLVKAALLAGKTVIVPADGLGTGLSELPQRAPVLYQMLVNFFREHSDTDHPCPWTNK